MPSGGGGGSHKCAGSRGRRRKLQGVERPRTVTAKEGVPGTKILHRNTSRVKLDGNRIISGEFSNREQIFNDVRCYEDIVETERARDSRVASADNWKNGSVPNNNGGRNRGGWRRNDHTRVGCDVGGSTRIEYPVRGT
jgi:hypothetical protein